MVTPIAGLPEISENQANKAITHNTALRQLEINLGAVISRTLTTPPSSPAEGALYIVPTGASGAWSGQTNKIAQWSNGGWNIYNPFQYQRLYSIADSAVIIYVGTSWSVFNSSGGGSGDMLKSIYDTDNDGIVDSAESVVDGAITTTKIANDAVTYAKIQNVTTNRLLGRVSAGNGDTEEIIIGAGLSVSGTTLSATGGSGGGREQLTANRIYYVRTDGSDSNNGLTNDSAGAFLTIQKAIDTISGNLDLGNFDAIVNIADGTYSSGYIELKTVPSSGGKIVLQGNIVTPSNVIINITSGSGDPLGAISALGVKTVYLLCCFRVQTSSGNFSGAVCSGYGSLLYFHNIDFGSCSQCNSHIQCVDGGYIFVDGNYSISGNSPNHYWCNVDGILRCQNKTITISNNLIFLNNFALADFGGKIVHTGCTFALNQNTVTGKKHTVSQAGQIITMGGSNYFPGTIAGTIDNTSYGLYV